ncbi:MAG: PKD domain-containing protein [Candidatus Methanodesulfokora sp.]|jgi:PKD repeat protein
MRLYIILLALLSLNIIFINAEQWRCPFYNQPPVVSITNITISQDGYTVTFALHAYDPERDAIVAWFFDYGDGTVENKTGAPPSRLSHRYSNLGYYTVIFKAKDSYGSWSSPYVYTVNAFPNLLPPYAVIDYVGPNPAVLGSSIVFSGHGVDPLGKKIVSWVWDFGDGSRDQGTGFIANSTHKYSKDGVYVARLTFKNEKDLWSAAAVVTVKVYIPGTETNVPPKIEGIIINPKNPLVGQNISFSVSATDPDDSIVAAEWSMGDGTYLSGFSVKHSYIQAGEYVVSVRVRDARGAMSSYSTRINVAGNKPPNATIIEINVNGMSVELRGMGSDPDGQVVAFFVDWGDGTVDNGSLRGNGAPVKVNHIYRESGSYIIRFKVRDDLGSWSSDEMKQVNIESGGKIQAGYSIAIMIAAAGIGTFLLKIILGRRSVKRIKLSNRGRHKKKLG